LIFSLSGVYFIRRLGDGAIKIGYSRDVARRINKLQTGCPDALTLAGLLVGGTLGIEAWLKRLFAGHSIRGEWFKPCDELLFCASLYPPPEFFNEDRAKADKLRRIRRYIRKVNAEQRASRRARMEGTPA
jgi:hypothetical protein